jgi:hypothetical protein
MTGTTPTPALAATANAPATKMSGNTGPPFQSVANTTIMARHFAAAP